MLQSVTGNHGVDVVAGKGIELYDANGKVYLDLNEISTVLGQKNEHFNKRMTEKLNGLVGGKIANSAEKEKFYRYLSETTGNRFRYVHLTSSGSEASEWAVRMALKMTGRNEVLAFWNSIHGRTYLSASMSGMPRRKQGYAPAASGVVYGVYPDCTHCPFDKDCNNCNFFCLKFLDEKIKYESSQEIGAVIVETYQGAGIIVPPKGWLKALQDWAHEHGAVVELHSCGFIQPLVPDLVEIGIDSLNPLEIKAGMDPVYLKKTFGDKLAFHGGINAQIMDQPDLVRAEMERLIPLLKEGGGYVFASDHSIPNSVLHKTRKTWKPRNRRIHTFL